MAKCWFYQGMQNEWKNIQFVPENHFHFQVFADQRLLKFGVWLWMYWFSINITYKHLSVSVWTFYHVKQAATSSLLQTLRNFSSYFFEQVTCQLYLMPSKIWSSMTQQNLSRRQHFSCGVQAEVRCLDAEARQSCKSVWLALEELPG